MENFGPTSHRFMAQRQALNYLDWGNSQAPLLVLVHGGQDHARSWDWIAQELRNDWHVVCPDLRGHGDSAWASDGGYSMPLYVSDLAQLILQNSDTPVSIVSHSLGGAVALRYAGLYPNTVRRLAVIEGLGNSPLDPCPEPSMADRWRDWISERRMFGGRTPRRYISLEEACKRMGEANPHLSPDRVRHLTIHGTTRNEDGSYSWKFDNYVRSPLPNDVTDDELHQLWRNIQCPVWLVHGADSWAYHPGKDGRSQHFLRATITSYKRAGHWVHHDRFHDFVNDLRSFLSACHET